MGLTQNHPGLAAQDFVAQRKAILRPWPVRGQAIIAR